MAAAAGGSPRTHGRPVRGRWAATALHPTIDDGSSSRCPGSSGRARERLESLGIATNDRRDAASDRLIAIADRGRGRQTGEGPVIASARDRRGHAMVVDPMWTEWTAKDPRYGAVRWTRR